MATFFSQQPDGDEVRFSKPVGPGMEKRPMVIGALLSVIVLVGLWLGWAPANQWFRSAMGNHYADAAVASMEKEDWVNAFQSAFKARRWAPEDLGVLHAFKRLLTESGADPAGLIQVLEQIEEKEQLGIEDQVSLARSYIIIGKPQEARAVHERLPDEARHRPEVLGMMVSVLQAEGHEREAKDMSQKALQSAPESPIEELKQIEADLGSSFTEVRAQAWQRMWQLARTSDSVAMQAVTHLTICPDLTVSSAEELLAIVKAHPHQGLHVRLGVVSALARLQPTRKAQLLQDEVSRFEEGEGSGDLPVLARWLALEKQHALITQLIPVKLAGSSRELYPILAQSLAEEKKWEELKKMLTSGRPPVSPSRVALWLAEAEAHLGAEMSEVRRQLELSLKNAQREHNRAALLSVVSIAEKHSLPDIAMRACLEGATGADAASVQMLQKAEELARLQKDADALLEVSRRLCAARPSSTVFAGRLAYLKLVLGVDMETADTATGDSRTEKTKDDVPNALLNALVALRLGGGSGEPGLHAVPIRELDGLPPGQRAVAAGLLQMAGRAGEAFQIAEKVPEALLLDEELAFLKKAR